jgi:hypothetical protein
MTTTVGKFSLSDITIRQFVLLFWEGDYIPNFDHVKKGEVGCVLSEWQPDTSGKMPWSGGYTRNKAAKFPLPLKLPWLPEFAELAATHHMPAVVENKSVKIVERTNIQGIPWVDPTIILTWTVTEKENRRVDVIVDISFEYGYYSLIQSMLEMNTISEMNGHYVIWEQEAISFLADSNNHNENGIFTTQLKHMTGFGSSPPAKVEQPVQKVLSPQTRNMVNSLLSPQSIVDNMTPGQASPALSSCVDDDEDAAASSEPVRPQRPLSVVASVHRTQVDYRAESMQLLTEASVLEKSPLSVSVTSVDTVCGQSIGGEDGDSRSVNSRGVPKIVSFQQVTKANYDSPQSDYLMSASPRIHIERKMGRLEVVLSIAFFESEMHLFVCFVTLAVSLSTMKSLPGLSGIIVDSLIAALWLYTIHLFVILVGNTIMDEGNSSVLDKKECAWTSQQFRAQTESRSVPEFEAPVALPAEPLSKDVELVPQKRPSIHDRQPDDGTVRFTLRRRPDAFSPEEAELLRSFEIKNESLSPKCDDLSEVNSNLDSNVDSIVESTLEDGVIDSESIVLGDDDDNRSTISHGDAKLVELLASFHELCVEGLQDLNPPGADKTAAAGDKLALIEDRDSRIRLSSDGDSILRVASTTKNRSDDEKDEGKHVLSSAPLSLHSHAESLMMTQSADLDEFDIPLVEVKDNNDGDIDEEESDQQLMQLQSKQRSSRKNHSNSSKSVSAVALNNNANIAADTVLPAFMAHAGAFLANPSTLFYGESSSASRTSVGAVTITAKSSSQASENEVLTHVLSAAGSFFMNSAQIFSASVEAIEPAPSEQIIGERVGDSTNNNDNNREGSDGSASVVNLAQSLFVTDGAFSIFSSATSSLFGNGDATETSKAGEFRK